MNDNSPDRVYAGTTSGVPKTLAERLIALRRKRGLSASDLARKSGVDRSNISRIESGRHQPTATTINKLASALEIEPGAIFVIPGNHDVDIRTLYGSYPGEQQPEVSVRELLSRVQSSMTTVRGALGLLASREIASDPERLDALVRIARENFQEIVDTIARFAALEEEEVLKSKTKK